MEEEEEEWTLLFVVRAWVGGGDMRYDGEGVVYWIRYLFMVAIPISPFPRPLF